MYSIQLRTNAEELGGSKYWYMIHFDSLNDHHIWKFELLGTHTHSDPNNSLYKHSKPLLTTLTFHTFYSFFFALDVFCEAHILHYIIHACSVAVKRALSAFADGKFSSEFSNLIMWMIHTLNDLRTKPSLYIV